MTQNKTIPKSPSLNTHLLQAASRTKWESIGTHKRAGVALPLFSVYSKESIGIGDLSDLKLLVDWCALTGNSILQLLPMNQMGALSCPYDSESSFALEIVYCAISKLSSHDLEIKEKIESLKKAFPAGNAYVDYGLREEKRKILWEIYQREGDGHPDFKDFREDNAYWLTDFALFKVLKEYYEGLPWYEWEKKYQLHEKKALESFEKDHRKKIVFYEWLQWKLYAQFKEAKSYAQSKNIFFKGDLPVFVSRDSADVWAHPEFFKLEFAAGAPPDMYCAKGQRWGMPTYNWEAIAEADFQYLKEKLKFAQNFYDILRIDHVVGLFRVWSIPYNEPMENQGLNGSFDPWDEGKWGEHGRKILLTMLNSSSMLLCAEDLGVIPQVCTDTLAELGIPGNDVQRWVKDWYSRHDFLPAEEYRQLSVAMLSTHDTTNWAGWWENEAGTIDEELFIRKCNEKGIDFTTVKDALFDVSLSKHGRLRWSREVDSIQNLIYFLGKPAEEVGDIIYMYENSFAEKEKFWKLVSLKGKVREKCDKEIISSALKLSLQSSAVFAINLITDLLYLMDVYKGDSYQYRFNIPGTISAKNWSQTLPISLEELLNQRINKDLLALVRDSKRKVQ